MPLPARIQKVLTGAARAIRWIGGPPHENFSIEEQFLNYSTFAAGIAFTVAMFGNIGIQLNPLANIGTKTGIGLQIVAYMLSRFKRAHTAAAWLFFISTFSALSINALGNAGIDSLVFAHFTALIPVIVFIMRTARSMIALTIIVTAYVLGLLWLNYAQPALFVPYPDRLTRFIDIAISYFIQFGFLFFLSYLFKKGYNEARDHSVRVQAQLAHHENLASIGTLADGLAHELNNPLAIAGGNLELFSLHLKKSGAQDEETTSFLERQFAAYTRITAITRNLQQFARPEKAAQAPLNAAELISDTVMLFFPAYQRQGVYFDWEVPPGVLSYRVLMARGEFQKVLTHLFENAKDAILAAPGRKGKGSIRIAMNVREGRIRISIHDNGPGIPPELLPRIFDPFFTTKAPGKGTGLGLSQVYSIITQAGGRITVENDPAGGAQATIELPVHAP